MTEKDKQKRICDEYDRLSKYFEGADANRRAIIEPLIQNAAFMRITLEEMQAAINREGVTDHYRNGEHQEGKKSSAGVQGYNAMIKNYTTVIKTLMAHVPTAPRAIELTSQERREPEETEEEKRKRINDEIARAAAWQQEQRAKEAAAEN